MDHLNDSQQNTGCIVGDTVARLYLASGINGRVCDVF